jgi:hypothetical protein
MARVAIACQGGGSPTAFTAGVLQHLLAHDDHRIVAVSGTSGGAICAPLSPGTGCAGAGEPRQSDCWRASVSSSLSTHTTTLPVGKRFTLTGGGPIALIGRTFGHVTSPSCRKPGPVLSD